MDMDFKEGDRISYAYPEPLDSNNKIFVGILDTIGDAFVYIKSDEGVRLKVSFKHFHLLKHFKETNSKPI